MQYASVVLASEVTGTLSTGTMSSKSTTETQLQSFKVVSAQDDQSQNNGVPTAVKYVLIGAVATEVVMLVIIEAKKRKSS